MLDKETMKYLNEIENVAYRCIIDAHYFEMITANTNKEFWAVVQNAIGDGVCIYWCHLFGNRGDNLHYSKFFARSDILAIGQEYSTECVKKRILNTIGYNNEEYNKFHEEVKNCRDKFLAHKEIDAKGIYPNIEKCRLMAEELRLILSELIEKCKEKFPCNRELFFWHIHYSQTNNKQLHNKCLVLYNARIDDSSNIESEF